MSAVAIIPARWGSTRFPGKPLALLAGKPLIQHVWERCLRAKKLTRVIVATDDMRIAGAAFDFGAEVALTSPKHPTGSDRLAEVAARLRGISVIVNVQGDEPFIEPRLIDRLVTEMKRHPRAAMITAATPFADESAAANPNNVKVVADRLGNALYFSRSLIPFERDGTHAAPRLHHLGIYGYRRAFLLEYVRWKPTPLEQAEKLEQLRALETGARIRLIVTKHRGIGIDTPEDLAEAERIIEPRQACRP
ncbi:MAG: 3-deoxy-manno-octulosonate cytidylyltransferase [Terrimicrobiaceae bacterium]|nr:3-deoxy-manno-octulosonate cytidylyltransferase [Terrimicrobiaceae bacterium]